MLRRKIRLRLETAPIIDDREMAVSDRHRHRQVIVGNVSGDAIEPRQGAFREVHEVPHDEFVVVIQPVGAGVREADAALARYEEAVLRCHREECVRCRVQGIARSAWIEIAVKNLESAVG